MSGLLFFHQNIKRWMFLLFRVFVCWWFWRLIILLGRVGRRRIVAVWVIWLSALTLLIVVAVAVTKWVAVAAVWVPVCAVALPVIRGRRVVGGVAVWRCTVSVWVLVWVLLP